MRNRRSIEIMPCLSQAFGSQASFVAFDAFGDFLFFNSKKKEAKNAALRRRGVLCTAQIALWVAQHALACQVGCQMNMCCETALRAVRDGLICLMVFWDGIFAMASLNDCGTSIEIFSMEGNRRGDALVLAYGV